MSEARTVEIVLDFVCAGSYLGFTRLQRAANRYRTDGGVVDVRFQPFQLRPDAPLDGGTHFDLLRRERGEQTALAIADDTTLGTAEGLVFNFRKALFTNTFEAHRLLLQAASQGRGEDMAERLFRAYFTEGMHLSDRTELTRLAAETGVEPTGVSDEELRGALARGRELGIESTPVFRFTNGPTLSDVQSTDTLLVALNEHR
jgi:predicted DsbA family dithiol-disulfide isomerase